MRADVKFRFREDLYRDNKCCKNAIIEVKTCTFPVLFVSIYQLPNTDISEFIKTYGEILQSLRKEKSSKIVIGLYHNLDFLKSHKHRQTEEFIDLNIDNDLYPSITRPTRITQASASLIDNIIIDETFHRNFQRNIIVSDFSDHHS